MSLLLFVAWQSPRAAALLVPQSTLPIDGRHHRGHSTPNLATNVRVEPVVGKVSGLFCSDYLCDKASSVEALTKAEGYPYQADTRPSDNVYDPTSTPARLLPLPTCELQITTQSGYISDMRKANMRLVEIAVCEQLARRSHALPNCNQSSSEVCTLTLRMHVPADLDRQEAHLAAPMALAAYSEICALGWHKDNPKRCAIQHSILNQVGQSTTAAVGGGLAYSNGHVFLRKVPGPGWIDLKMNAASQLGLSDVILPEASWDDFEQTNFYEKQSRSPPTASFCQDLACLIEMLMPSGS